jgi:hypothetical protein
MYSDLDAVLLRRLFKASADLAWQRMIGFLILIQNNKKSPAILPGIFY